jgi:hypothetical protein
MSSYQFPATSSSSSGLPVGTVVQGQFADRPTEYLPCDGSSYLKTAYPLLDKTGLDTLGSNQLVTRTMPVNANWGQVAGVAGGTLIATSSSSILAKSLDGGATWVSIVGPVAGTVPLASSIAYLNGEWFVPHFSSAIIYKTSDAGVTWSAQTSPGVCKHIAAIGNNLVIDNQGFTANMYRSSTGMAGSWVTISITGNTVGTLYYGMVVRNGTLVVTRQSPSDSLVTRDGVTWGVVPAPEDIFSAFDRAAGIGPSSARIAFGYATPFTKDRWFYDWYVADKGGAVLTATGAGATMSPQYSHYGAVDPMPGRVANVNGVAVKIAYMYGFGNTSLATDGAGNLLVSYDGADNWQYSLTTPFNLGLAITLGPYQNRYYTESGNRAFFTSGIVGTTIATLDIDTTKFRTPVKSGYYIKAA